MNPRVTAVEAMDGYRVRLSFTNGEKKLFDMTPYLDKGIFRELVDTSYFKSVRVCAGSICWPHEQDLCPDTLYENGQPIKV
jgi:hypothetical protein